MNPSNVVMLKLFNGTCVNPVGTGTEKKAGGRLPLPIRLLLTKFCTCSNSAAPAVVVDRG